MTLHEEQKKVQKAINHSLAHVQEDPWLAQRVLANAKGEEPVVKKISASMILVIVLLCLAITAIAAGIIYNQDWWWNNRNSMEKSDKPELYEAVMANMVENPEQIQCEDDQVQLTIQDVSWAPEADIMTISFKATPKHPNQDELHSMWALDTDGSYIGEGGSVTVTDDSEDRAMHWLWRTDIGLEGSGGYGHIPGYGPVSDMMDDRSMHLLLLDYTGTNIIINSDEAENAVDMFPMESSMDMFRTTSGDVYFVGKFDLSWLREEYDQEMRQRAEETPDMKEYYDQRISIAQAARERIGKEGITCILTYRVVEYTEEMDDMDLYTNESGRSVQFIIRPKQ